MCDGTDEGAVSRVREEASSNVLELDPFFLLIFRSKAKSYGLTTSRH